MSHDDRMDDATHDALDDALDAWTPVPPPADFADRVLAARDAQSPPARAPGDAIAHAAPPPPPRRWQRSARSATWLAAAAAVAATVIGVVRPSPTADSGTVTTTQRHTQALGERGLAVAEPGTELAWYVDARGAADITQRTGNAFYRVERGGPFVVHTPAGDVRVTGTCFRIEVTDMTPRQKMFAAGVAGAALASAVLVTVYEGHVIAETRAARAELAAGDVATLRSDDAAIQRGASPAPPLTTGGAFDEAHASRGQLIARARQQEAQLLALRAQLASVEKLAASSGLDVPEPGRRWRDPSPEKLAAWVAECRVRIDEPSLERFEPSASVPGVEANEIAGYNAALGEVAAQWKALVRRLYVEVTGDTANAENLSVEAMRHEIEDKSPPELHNQVLQQLARERAGQAAAPTDPSKLPALEQLMRAYAALGDQSEAAVAKRLGAKRASDIRGDGWGARSDNAGCPAAPK